jgi:Arc/MetJ-type ribon-helix-helix transcriptional regulator
MTVQIAVLLPDETVAFLDSVVAGGGASSRAELITRALAREQRRLGSEKDAQILAALASEGVHDDLDNLVAWTSANPADDPESL